MKHSYGLTLIELMVTLAVFAIVTVLAFPGFKLYQQNSNRVSQINSMVASFNLARSEAVKRNLPVVVCASADQASCTGANNWTTGWISFVDSNSNGVLDGGEPLIYAHGRLSGANLILGDVDNNGTDRIIFRANGTSNTAATFMRCDDRFNTDTLPNAHARAIILTASGRTRLSRDGNDTGNIQENAAGIDLDCSVPPT
ncbi:MAG TPA: prepilin-type N-terminal cleavage/methylation domain-containing protein [Gammaproteobacteria bacterium]|nr:prepilin-type N-terminal cleavage/methylation domain-containing protein [Gammaproteobacteria bacterium]